MRQTGANEQARHKKSPMGYAMDSTRGKRIRNYFEKHFYFATKCDIIQRQTNLNNCANKIQRGYYTLLGIRLCEQSEFDKMQIPFLFVWGDPFAQIGLATIGVCVFVRLLR